MTGRDWIRVGCALLALAGAAAGHEDGVAARVNGTAITDAMVNDVVKGVIAGRPKPPSSEEIAQLSNEALESLIDLELLYQAALAQKLTVSDLEINAEIARSRQRFADEAAYKAALKKSGLSPEQLRAETRKTLLVNKFLADVVWKGAQVAPGAPQRFYEEHRAEMTAAAPSGTTPSFKSMEGWIHQTLLQQARDERQRAYVAELKRTAKIEIPDARPTPPR